MEPPVGGRGQELKIVTVGHGATPAGDVPRPSGMALFRSRQRLERTLYSFDAWIITLAFAALMLLCEVIKGARPGAKYLTDHLLSLIVFGAAAAEFVLWPKFGTSIYFLLTLFALVDFLAGVSLRRRRGAVPAATAPVASKKGRDVEAPAAEPQFEQPAPPLVEALASRALVEGGVDGGR